MIDMSVIKLFFYICFNIILLVMLFKQTYLCTIYIFAFICKKVRVFVFFPLNINALFFLISLLLYFLV